MNLGERVRSLRKARSLTVSAFAQQVGVSPGLISQVERGLTDPSLGTVRNLARVLEVPLFELFQEENHSDPVRVVRAGERVVFSSPHSDITYTKISGGPSPLDVMEGVLMPGAASSEGFSTHPSDECVMVMEGHLSIELETGEWLLGPGDSCTFDSRLPHRFTNPKDDTQCRFVVAMTPPTY